MHSYRFQSPKPLIQSSNASVILAVVAGLSLLIYLFVFVYPYNIFHLYPYTHLAIYSFAESNPLLIWWLALMFTIQCGLYWLGWRAAHQAKGKTAWLIVLGGALAFSLALLCIYPIDAADIFDYIMYGRISSLYGGNPFHNLPNQFTADPFYAYVGWPDTPSDYGPIWQILTSGVTWLAGNSIIANVLALKLLCLLFLGLGISLVAIVLQRVAPERALAGVTFLAWNPVILYETVGNGHNDIAMAVWFVAAAWAILSRRYTLATLALIMGALVKFIPLLLLPSVGLIALRNLSSLRARLRFIIVTALSTITLIVITYSPFWYGLDTLGLYRRSELFTASLLAFVRALFLLNGDFPDIDWQLSAVAAGLTLLFVLWQSWRVWQNPSWLCFCQVTLNILLFYLLITCSWFQQWYTIWPLCVAALLPAGQSVYLAMLLSGYTILSKHIIFGPLLYRLYPLYGPQRALWFAPAVLGLPWLYALFLLTRRFLHRINVSVEET